MLSVVGSTWTFKQGDLFTALDMLHLLGVDDVELWAEGAHLDPRLPLPDVGEVGATLDRLGLLAHSMHAPFRALDLTVPDAEAQRERVALIAEVFDTAAALDCPYVVVHADGAGDEFTAASPAERQAALERAATSLRELCARAADADVTVLIENQPDATGTRIGARVAELLRLVQLTDASNLGVCFDVAHAVVSTGGWEAELHAALPHLRSVHVSDTDGPTDAHWPLGQGTVDWAAVVAALVAGGYDEGLVLEVAGGEEAVQTSLAELRRIDVA